MTQTRWRNGRYYRPKPEPRTGVTVRVYRPGGGKDVVTDRNLGRGRVMTVLMYRPGGGT
ncbi:hypothetical protein WN55_08988 [Dufourea novaeangliae]|uniref:Uncharacterized protein n=1 Tax=Dufourea novaeangliae TaxID=178035 RepID=A0A154P691_DUFNO|nr:hypothetical protein WN55_08988 [Dufourea novaeangliae]